MIGPDFNKIVEELKSSIKFKSTTVIGDLVLIVNETDDAERPISAVYAVATDFVRDVTKRDEWWHVQFMYLWLPPQPRVLILQEPHFTGQEIFTIGGKKVFIQALDFTKSHQPEEEPAPEPGPGKSKPRSGLRVIK